LVEGRVLSSESDDLVDVFFDDLKVTHVKSPVIQADDYYPFGLMFNSYQRENSTPNRWRFQGQEHIDDLGLNWDTFKWRNHQPDIGRFFNVDPLAEKYAYNGPFAFSENKVTAHVELEGLEAWPIMFFARPSPTVRPVSVPRVVPRVVQRIGQTGAKGSSPSRLPKEVIENFRRENTIEREQLAQRGLEKNTQKYKVTDSETGKTTETIPDSFTKGDRQTVEVKGVKEQSLTEQLRAQRQISNENGQMPKLIIRQGAKLSKPLQEGGFEIKYFSAPPVQQDATRVATPMMNQLSTEQVQQLQEQNREREIEEAQEKCGCL
jgi:RHS repeat-associated protein